MALHKILKIVALILSLAGIVFLALILSKGGEQVTATGEGVDGFLYVAYITFLIVLVSVVIFVFKGLFSGDIKKTLLTVGGFLLIVVVSYVLADGTETVMKDGNVLTANGSRLVSTGLYVFYVLAVLAIASMILGGVVKVKNR